MHHENDLILTLVGAFVLAFAFGMIALKLKLPPLIGYLAAGVIAGPFTPGWVADAGIARQLAEIGIILLMFGVGLHFSPSDLGKVWRVAVPGALLQILLGTGLGWGLGAVLGMPATEALLLGLALAVASTVVVLRTLEGRCEPTSRLWRIAVGWLVVQDMAVIVALVFLPLLLESHGRVSIWALSRLIGSRLVELSAFLLLMIFVGARVLPWMLVKIEQTRSRELFTLGVLAIALGIAWTAHEVFGASFALGAFAAGLVLNGTTQGHDAGERSLPLRDAFAVLFFVSVGMLFDPGLITREPAAIVAILGATLFCGLVSAFVVARLAHLTHDRLGLLAASLPQIGEFSFVLAALAVSLGAMSERTRGLIVAAAILSIAINPLLIWLSTRLFPPGSGADGDVGEPPGSQSQ